jgi:hypothetical protein
MIEMAQSKQWTTTAGIEPMNLNLGERRGTARLMSAWQLHAEVQRCERDEELRHDGRRRREGNDLRQRTCGWGTPKGAILEMGVSSRVVVLMMRRHLYRVSRWTRFQQKRRAAGRHEADRHVGAKQQDDQQQAGE